MTDIDQQDGVGLARSADADSLRELFWAGVLPRQALDAAFQEIGYERRWKRWCDVLLLVLGGSLLLAGIIFFIAYNWQAMDKMVKLGGLQVMILGCAGAAWLRGLEHLAGRALLFAACLLVGVYLAAFGQIYQTGADAWELFRGWAFLIVLWVIASRAPVHWVLLLAVTDAAIALYLDQVHFYRWEREVWAWLILAATQVLALVGFEAVSRRSYFLLRQTWPRWLLVPVVFFFLLVPTTVVIFDGAYDDLESWMLLTALATCVVGGYGYYRHVAPDLFPLTCIGFSCAWVATLISIRVLDVGSSFCGSLVIVGLFVVGMLTYLVRWLRRVNVEMRKDG